MKLCLYFFWFAGIALSCDEMITPRQYIEEISVGDLDKRIQRVLENPVAGNGRKLLLDCNRYYDELFTIHNYIEENNSKGMELYAKVNQTGGPQFLTVETNIGKLKTSFNWTTNEPEEYELLIVAIKRIWRNLNLVASNTTS